MVLSDLGTVGLLTRAADAAGKAASHCQHEWPKRSTWQVILDRRPWLRSSEFPLAASGPDHWRAVEALIRAVAEEHRPLTEDVEYECRVCVTYGSAPMWPCPTLAAVRPLAEQVLRDLGAL